MKQHGRHAGADRGLGHRDIDGVVDDQDARHQEAVDAGEHDDAEEIAHPNDGDRDDDEQRQQHRIDETVYDRLPSSAGGASGVQ